MRYETVLKIVKEWVGGSPYCIYLATEIHKLISRRDAQIKALKAEIKRLQTRRP